MEPQKREKPEKKVIRKHGPRKPFIGVLHKEALAAGMPDKRAEAESRRLAYIEKRDKQRNAYAAEQWKKIGKDSSGTAPTPVRQLRIKKK